MALGPGRAAVRRPNWPELEVQWAKGSLGVVVPWVEVPRGALPMCTVGGAVGMRDAGEVGGWR